jgi:hypothetical protein
MGVWSIASNLPSVLAPALGSVVIGGASALGINSATAYRAVFGLAGIFLLLGGVFIFRVQESRPLRLAPIN